MQSSWLSLLPPLIVLITAFATRRLYVSLIVGIFSAAFIATMGGSGDKGAFETLENIINKKPNATLTIIDKDIKKNNTDVINNAISEFISKLK